VVVLGDFGRSPRMQYHALSLAKQARLDVDVVAYAGSTPRSEILREPRIHLHLISPPPAWLARYLPRVLALATRVLLQLFQLAALTLARLPRPDYVLLQTPPCAPAFTACRLVSLLRGAATRLRDRAFVRDRALVADPDAADLRPLPSSRKNQQRRRTTPLLASVLAVKIKRKHGAKKADEDGFYDAETPEERAQRKADALARVAGIEALLKEQSAALEASRAKADASVAQLTAALSEKCVVERMLDEMERKKEAAELEKEEMRSECDALLDKVTVLTDARQADHVAHAVVVRRWRDELVAYQEKTPKAFLAEIVALVGDMDNEVEIELADAEVMAKRADGGVRRAKGEELVLCDEWTHNPNLAMARPDRLARLAAKARAPLALADAARILGAEPDAAAAGAGEMKMSTPTMVAKRRTALGEINKANDRAAPLPEAPAFEKAKSPAVVAKTAEASAATLLSEPSPRTALRAEMAAARLEMAALKSESKAAGLLDANALAGAGPASPGVKPLGSRNAGHGFKKASVNLGSFGFNKRSAPAGVKPSRAAAAVAFAANGGFDDFGAENVAPAGGRSIVVSPR